MRDLRALRILPVVFALATLGVSVTEAKTLRVVTTLEDLSSIAQEVGGERIETFSLARGYQDPHYVDAKPSFILRLSRADLLIVAGLELEIGYLPPLVDQSRNAAIHVGGPGYLDASKTCEILEVPTTAVTRAMGDVHPYGNPHYWTDPENGLRIARAIAAKLEMLDPAGAEAYASNLARFEEALRARLTEWKERMAPFTGVEVVTFHNSWPNFAERFGLDVVAHVEPKPGIPPTPSHTLQVINKIRDDGIGVILVEPYFDLKTPSFIAGKTGAEVVTLYPSVGGIEEIEDYFDLFEVNIDTLVNALERHR